MRNRPTLDEWTVAQRGALHHKESSAMRKKKTTKTVSVQNISLDSIVKRLQSLAGEFRSACMEAGRLVGIVLANPDMVPDGTKPIEYLADNTHWGETSLRRFGRIYADENVRELYLAGTNAPVADKILALANKDTLAGEEAVRFARLEPNANPAISAKVKTLNNGLGKKEQDRIVALFAQHPDDGVSAAMTALSEALDKYNDAKAKHMAAQNRERAAHKAWKEAEAERDAAQAVVNQFRLEEPVLEPVAEPVTA